jgi:hypothetical protein
MDNLLEQPYSRWDVDKAQHEINVDRLKQLVHQDPKLQSPDKTTLLGILNHPNALSILLSGAAGAALATSIAKYEKLDSTSQALLGLAGFGIGSVIIQHIGQDQSHLVDYKSGQGFKIQQ